LPRDRIRWSLQRVIDLDTRIGDVMQAPMRVLLEAAPQQRM
jgi:hypothetical protein